MQEMRRRKHVLSVRPRTRQSRCSERLVFHLLRCVKHYFFQLLRCVKHYTGGAHPCCARLFRSLVSKPAWVSLNKNAPRKIHLQQGGFCPVAFAYMRAEKTRFMAFTSPPLVRARAGGSRGRGYSTLHGIPGCGPGAGCPPGANTLSRGLCPRGGNVRGGVLRTNDMVPVRFTGPQRRRHLQRRRAPEPQAPGKSGRHAQKL